VDVDAQSLTARVLARRSLKAVRSNETNNI
jgi:hypothetical protein